MKKIFFFLVSVTCLCISCNVIKRNSFSPSKNYSSSELTEDFTVLREVLQANHPSLYWYSTKDSVDAYFSSTSASLKDSLTEQQFRNKVAWTISKIHCGHTTVRASKSFSDYYTKHKFPQFPLLLKVWEDSAVVINNLLNDSILKRGTIITALNGLTTKQVVDSISQFISTDGYSNNFKYQAISFNFPAYYKNTFGIDSQYAIKYIDSLGSENEVTVKNYTLKRDTAGIKEIPSEESKTKKQLRKLKLLAKRNLQIDSTLKTAYLSVNTFSEGKLVGFFNRSFKKIKNQEIKNVVLDLRLNTGGSVIACTRLSQFLVDKPFHVADTVAAFTRSFPYKENIKPWFIYWLSMHLSGKRYKSDNRIHFRYFEKHYFKPKKKNHFDGKIYLLTGGYTFSAATLVASNLKGQKNVTIVGEETGGGAYGNSAMHLTTIVLPNTGVRVTLPLFRMVLDASRPKNGRGIFPDVEVKPSSTAIKMGIDAKLEKVKELIRKNQD